MGVYCLYLTDRIILYLECDKWCGHASGPLRDEFRIYDTKTENALQTQKCRHAYFRMYCRLLQKGTNDDRLFSGPISVLIRIPLTVMIMIHTSLKLFSIKNVSYMLGWFRTSLEYPNYPNPLTREPKPKYRLLLWIVAYLWELTLKFLHKFADIKMSNTNN